MRLRNAQESRLWTCAFTGQLVHIARDAEGLDPLEGATVAKVDDHHVVALSTFAVDPVADVDSLGGRILHSPPVFGHFLALHACNVSTSGRDITRPTAITGRSSPIGHVLGTRLVVRPKNRL